MLDKTCELIIASCVRHDKVWMPALRVKLTCQMPGSQKPDKRSHQCDLLVADIENTQAPAPRAGHIASATAPASVHIDQLAAGIPAPAPAMPQQPSAPQTYGGTAQLPHGVAGGDVPVVTAAPSAPAGGFPSCAWVPL